MASTTTPCSCTGSSFKTCMVTSILLENKLKQKFLFVANITWCAYFAKINSRFKGKSEISECSTVFTEFWQRASFCESSFPEDFPPQTSLCMVSSAQYWCNLQSKMDRELIIYMLMLKSLL